MRHVRKPWWRQERQAWQVYWLSDVKQHSRAFPASLFDASEAKARKAAADFRRRKLHQLNEEAFPEPMATPGDELVAEFLEHKEKIEGRTPSTLRIFQDTLAIFRNINGPVRSTQISQRHFNAYVIARRELVTPMTINKKLKTLRTVIRWAAHRNRRVEPQSCWTLS